jgi:predicted Zn finger-like uncharacterized protein
VDWTLNGYSFQAFRDITAERRHALTTRVISCPSCQTRYQIGPEAVGRKVKCKKCGQVLQVPAATPIQAPGTSAPPALDPEPSLGIMPDQGSGPRAPSAAGQPSQVPRVSQRQCPRCDAMVDADMPLCTVCGGPLHKKATDLRTSAEKEAAAELRRNWIIGGICGGVLLLLVLGIGLSLGGGAAAGFVAMLALLAGWFALCGFLLWVACRVGQIPIPWTSAMGVAFLTNLAASGATLLVSCWGIPGLAICAGFVAGAVTCARCLDTTFGTGLVIVIVYNLLIVAFLVAVLMILVPRIRGRDRAVLPRLAPESVHHTQEHGERC